MNKEIKYGVILNYIYIIISVLVALIYTPIMIRFLGQGEFGIYSLATSFMAYLSILDLGFGNAMIKYISRAQSQKNVKLEQKYNSLFLLLYTIIGIIAFVVGIILIKNINLLFDKSLTLDELNKTRIIMSILVVNIAISFPLSIFDTYVMSHEKFIFLKSFSIIKTILTYSTIILFLIFGYKSIAIVIINAVYTVFGHSIMAFYCIKKLKMKIRLSSDIFDKKVIKEIFGYSFFIFLNIIVDNLFNNTDKVILGSVSGAVAVSIYAIAAQASQLNMNFSGAVSGLFFPKVNKILDEEEADKKLSDLFLKVSRIQLYIMTLILFGFVIFGREFIILWAGQEFVEAYYVVILLMGPAIIPLTQNIGVQIVQAKNIHRFRSVVYIIIAILNVIISIPLARKYGCIGAAIGTALATLAGQIITMNIFYYKKAKIDIISYWKFFIKFVIMIGIPSGIYYIVYNRFEFNVLYYIISIIIYCIMYSIITYLNMNEEEKGYVLSLKNKILRKA